MSLEAEAGSMPHEAPEGAETPPEVNPEPIARDFETEARAMGWQPATEFKGDPGKCVDAKTFVERGETMLPFLKKALADEKRQFAEFRKEAKRALRFMGDAEQRGYQRAMGELQAKHDEAVETGNVQAARQAVKEMGELAKPEAPPIDDTPDPQQVQREFDDWLLGEGEWYRNDPAKRELADVIARQMTREHGPAHEWPGGGKAWLAELTNRVERKSAPKPVNPVNSGGNREGAGKGGRTLNDLPAAAKAQALKWDKAGVVKVDDYLRTYEWD